MVGPPWDEIFTLMWEAYTAGTIPVSAVVVDDAGAVVARGRNRIFDRPSGRELGASRLAHAEINALLALSSERTYEGWTLYSALEPCHLCLAAAHAARVGTVRFAASDRYGGATGKLAPSADHLAHPVTVEGPLPGDAGLLPELLLVAFFLWRRPEGDVVRFFAGSDPKLVELANRLPAPDAGATLSEAQVRLREARGSD
jgi:tRNA(Arg) A34 adenosine deaminase TadA